ncbi:hypothetical protein [Pseudonocardia oroxyli]|uniref:Uncharacterized protein n=1 Tax=Pseudonocardia oroxyli TaxID=366584 RepID=A0A1G7W8Z0_PSEOR|nr:hypothetical protein [Pseudonocardia oroxyli]SDG67570.1 hypothetical protein SAMN05216377_11423 [Pseudonocardia oroxyli]
MSLVPETLVEPPAQGWTSGFVRALRPGCSEPVVSEPAVSEHLARVRRAAAVAVDRHPGPVGHLLAATLVAYADQGWRGAPAGLSERLVAELLADPA